MIKNKLEGDLYLYEKVTDPEPRVYRGVFFDSEPVWEYYPERVRFIDGGKLHLEYITGPNDIAKERRVMDWATGELEALEPAIHSLPLTRGSVLEYAEDGGWRIVGGDGGIRRLDATDPEQNADPYIWGRSVPLSEDWVALLRGGGADLLHMPTGSIKAVKERLLPPLPWSGEAAVAATS